MATLSATRNSGVKGKDTRFFARISTLDRHLIEEAAAVTGQSVTSFVVSQARKAASEVLEHRNIIQLNKEESRRLMGALLSPAQTPTARMRRALSRYRKTVISDVNPPTPKVSKS